MQDEDEEEEGVDSTVDDEVYSGQRCIVAEISESHIGRVIRTTRFKYSVWVPPPENRHGEINIT